MAETQSGQMAGRGGGQLAGKVAIITGGANGIGQEAAMRFLAAGARVVVADLNEANGARTLELAAARGAADRIAFLRTDVAEEADNAAVVALAVERFGGLDCMVNNAGIGGAFGPVTDTTVEEWDFTFRVLVRGVFLGTKHAALQMKAQGRGGTIINTASVAGLGGGAGGHAYSGAKAAVVNMTRSIACELAPAGIRVNAIAPGGIMTELLHRGKVEETVAMMRGRQPWPEPGMPGHIADGMLFLASDQSEFIAGQCLVIDGGLLASGPNMFGFTADSPLLRKAGLDQGTTGVPIAIRDPSGR
ncbi:MAG: glucose 1-dehydrogenase [Sneathiellaceae bacterium]